VILTTTANRKEQHLPILHKRQNLTVELEGVSSIVVHGHHGGYTHIFESVIPSIFQRKTGVLTPAKSKKVFRRFFLLSLRGEPCGNSDVVSTTGNGRNYDGFRRYFNNSSRIFWPRRAP